MNPAFNIGYQVGTNFEKAGKEIRDEGIIDKILSDSMKTNDPNVLQNNIGAILRGVSPERQPAAIKFIESRMQNIQKQKQAQATRAAGFDPDINPTLAATKYKQEQKNEALEPYGLVPNQPQQQPQIQPQASQQSQQQSFVPGMQIPQSQGQQPIQNIVQPETQNEDRRRNPSLWTDEELVKAQGSPYAEIRNMANAEQTRRNEKKKDVASSYGGINEKFINKTYDKYEQTQRKEAIIDRMGQLEETGELSDSGVINFLEQLGFKQEWLKNPYNEEYTKLGLDLLGGGTLQEDYGSRVLASEFKVSQQRIPTLSQTPEGRKQIQENIRTLLLPSKLMYERMQYYLEKADRTGEPLPHDLRGKILRDIRPELDAAYDSFKQRNGRYKVKQGTFVDQNVKEKYYYLGEGNYEKIIKMMKEDGYDVP